MYSLDDLVRHVPDLLHGKRLKVILLQEVVGAEAEQLKDDTDVSMVVEPLQDLHTSTWEQSIKQSLVCEVGKCRVMR